MRRIGLAVILALSFALASLAAEAQNADRIPRVGVLVTGPPPGEHACVVAFRRGMTDLGYIEGRTHVLEIRATIRWNAGSSRA